MQKGFNLLAMSGFQDSLLSFQNWAAELLTPVSLISAYMSCFVYETYEHLAHGCWLVCLLTIQAKVIWEEGCSTEKIPP